MVQRDNLAGLTKIKIKKEIRYIYRKTQTKLKLENKNKFKTEMSLMSTNISAISLTPMKWLVIKNKIIFVCIVLTFFRKG